MLGLGTKLTSSSGLGDLRRDYNFLKGSLHSDVDFSRASNATQVGSDGYIKYAPNNLVSQSTFASGWSNVSSGGEIISTNNADPFGGNTAYLFGATGSQTNSRYERTVGLVNGQCYVASIYAKRNTSSLFQFSVTGDGSYTPAYAAVGYIDVDAHADGTMGLNASGGTYTPTNVTFTEVGNGWVRCSFKFVSNITTSAFTFRVRPDKASGLNSTYFYGPQLEATFGTQPTKYNESGSNNYYGARFDYDKDGNSKGLLIEEARTNLLVQSQDFTTSWVKTNVNTPTIASNIIDPSGGYGSYKLTEDTADYFHFIYLAPTIGASAHTLSCYMKKGERSTASLMLTQAGNVGAIFNLETGQVDSVTGTGNTAQIVDAGNGWYRCIITNSGSADIGDFARIGVQNGALGSYQGDGVSGIYIFGAQLENSTSSSSLVPTYGATADRAADVASVSGTAFSSFFKDTEGTFVVDAQVPKGYEYTNYYGRLFEASDGSSTDRIEIYINNNEIPVGNVRTGNVAQTQAGGTNADVSSGEIFSSTIGYKHNNTRPFTDNKNSILDTDVSIPTNLSELSIGGRYNSIKQLNGWIRRVRYFNKRKSDAQLQNLVSQDKLLQRFKGAKAAHSLRSLRDGRDSSPVTRIRREYDSYEADYTAAQVSNGELENDFKSEKQTTLPLDVSCEADEMIVGGDFTDLVTNGDFATDSGWTKGTGWTTTGGVATRTAQSGSTACDQNLTLVAGRKYTVTYTLTRTAGTFRVRFAGTTNVDGADRTASGTYTDTLTAATGNNQLRLVGADAAFAGTVDNVSVVEGSWTLGTGWTFGDGVATHASGSSSGLDTSFNFKKGKTYDITFDVISCSGGSGSVQARGNGSTASQTIDASTLGGNTFRYTDATNHNTLRFDAGSGTTMVIDNVSLKEVNPLATGFSTRLINADYKGKPLMRIRRQDNTEAELYADDNDQISLSSSIKGSSQNLLAQSEDFTQWSAYNGGTVTSGQADPFGGNNASKIISPNASAYNGIQLDTVKSASDTNYTFSYYQKKDSQTNLSGFEITYSGGTAKVGYYIVNPLTGTCILSSSSTAGVAASINVESVNDDWWRISATQVDTGANTTVRLRFYPGFSSNGTTIANLAGEMTIHAAQLEQTVHASSGSDIAVNGGFEVDSNWTDFGSPVTQNQSTEVVRTGTYSRKIVSSGNTKGIQSHTHYSITAGRKYRISAWIYAVDGGSDAGVKSGLGNTDQGVFTNRPVTEGQWTNITYDAIALSTVQAGTYLSFLTNGDTTTFYVDDVSITELPVESPSTYSQTPVVVSTHHSTDATDLQSFAGKENLIRKSEDFSSNWINNNLTLTADTSVTDPFGGTGAYKCVKTGNGAYQRLYDAAKDASGAALTGGAGDTYTFSIYVKPTGTTVGLRMTATGTSSAFQDITVTPNVWQRISFSHTTTGAYTGLTAFVYPCGTGADNDSTTGGDAHIFGAQVNTQVNTNSLKDYVATTGTVLTADINVVNWYSQSYGEDFVNATAGEQPRIVMGSELVTDSGGKASVYFDGGDTLDNNTLAGQNRLDSYFIQDTTDTQYIYPSGTNNSLRFGLTALDGSNAATESNYGTPSYYVNGALQSFSDRDDSHDALTGSTKLLSQHNASTGAWTGFTVGHYHNGSTAAAYNYTGKISEMVFFPNMDSSPKRFNIEQNMLRHFDVYEHESDFSTDLDGYSVSGSSMTTSFFAGNNDGIAGKTDVLRLTVDSSSGGVFHLLKAAIGTNTTSNYEVTFDYLTGGGGFADKFFQLGTAFASTLDTTGTIDAKIVADTTWRSVTLKGKLTVNNNLLIKICDTSAGSAATAASGLQGQTIYFKNIKVGVRNSDGFVTKLYDQSGNNCHATQSTAAHQCQLVSGGDLIKSGNHPAWEYPVSNPQRNLNIQGLGGLSTLDAFFVQDIDTAETIYTYPTAPNSDLHKGFVVQSGSGSSAMQYNYGSAVLEVNGTEQSPSSRGDLHGMLDGRILAYHRSGSTTGWDSVNVGHSQSGSNQTTNIENGKFSEMIWYDSDQHSNQSGIESNINTHYNIY